MENNSGESYINLRSQVKSRLIRFKSKFSELKQRGQDISESEVNQLKKRLSDFEPALKEFELIHCNIMELFDDETNEKDLILFEDSFYELIADVSEFLSEISKKPEGFTELKSPQQSNNLFHLPSVSLPSFSGDYEQWMEFYDTFNSLIHENQSLSDIQKFYYLVSCLQGEASEAIKSLKISNENYNIAWRILKKRFENKKLIIQNKIQLLFNLQGMEKDSHLSLQRFYDDVVKITQSLKNYQQPTVDTILIYIVSAKLSSNTRCEWEKFKCESEFPTFNEMLTFLEKRCDFLRSVEVIDASQQNLLQVNNNNNKSITSNSNGYEATNDRNCAYCKHSHSIRECETFLNLEINDRIRKAKRLHLCLNCLGKGHKTSFCAVSRMCQTCNKKHNTLLHIQRTQQNKKNSDTDVSETNSLQEKQL